MDRNEEEGSNCVVFGGLCSTEFEMQKADM